MAEVNRSKYWGSKKRDQPCSDTDDANDFLEFTMNWNVEIIFQGKFQITSLWKTHALR